MHHHPARRDDELDERRSSDDSQWQRQRQRRARGETADSCDIELELSPPPSLSGRTHDRSISNQSSWTRSIELEHKDLHDLEEGVVDGASVVVLPARGPAGSGGRAAVAAPGGSASGAGSGADASSSFFESGATTPTFGPSYGATGAEHGRGRKRTISRIASSLFLDKLHQFQAYQHMAGTPHREAEIGDDARRFNGLLASIHAKHPRIGRTLLYLRGPSPPWIESAIRPWWPQGEAFFARHLAFFQRRRRVITPIFLLLWLIAFIFLVRESFYDSKTNVGTPSFIVADTSFWAKDDQCGMNGTGCAPFTNYSLVFRCPSQTLDVQLLNNRAVGTQEVIYQPLVVGGGDALSTYRADSWICPAAIHHGLFGNRQGGCGRLEMTGDFTGFTGGDKNGVKSISFDSTFPSSYRFVEGVDQAGCQDIRDGILGFNVAMSTIFSFLIRPVPVAFFWTLLCMGFWQVVLASDPSAMPPDIATGFQYFLPALFTGYVFWHFSFRWVVPAFESAAIERTVWYLGGFWVGLLINVSLSWIPINRLTASDIQKEPGGLVAVICLVILLFLCVLNQLRVIRRTGWFYFYLFWYLVGGAIVGILSSLPGLTLRLHHYIAAIVLLPGCAFVTRPSALFQGFLLGMFLDGVGRWGFDSLLQTPASLVGDGALGSALPTFLTSATNFTVSQASIAWNAIPTNLADQWDGFSLLVDDVERYAGTATNYSISWLNQTIPHYFRIAYTSSGTSGDFTRAATAFISNGTWINQAAGPS